jgi:hypothetical protein
MIKENILKPRMEDSTIDLLSDNDTKADHSHYQAKE